MLPDAHYEQALSRLQRIIASASRNDPPITEHEAFEQIVEALELAGFGSPEMDPALLKAARDLEREPAPH